MEPNKKVSCLELFKTTVEKIQELIYDKDSLRKKAFYGDTILRMCIVAQFHDDIGINFKDSVETMHEKRKACESNIGLCLFLHEGTDLLDIGLYGLDRNVHFFGDLCEALIFDSIGEKAKSNDLFFNMTKYSVVVEKIIKWMNENMETIQGLVRIKEEKSSNLIENDKNENPEDIDELSILIEKARKNFKYENFLKTQNFETKPQQQVQQIEKEPIKNPKIPMVSPKQGGSFFEPQEQLLKPPGLSNLSQHSINHAQIPLFPNPPSIFQQTQPNPTPKPKFLGLSPNTTHIATEQIPELRPMAPEFVPLRYENSSLHHDKTRLTKQEVREKMPSWLSPLSQPSIQLSDLKYDDFDFELSTPGSKPTYVPIQEMLKDTHRWDGHRSRHTDICGNHSEFSWTGSQCLDCFAFNVQRKISNKHSKRIILGLEICPGDQVDWLTGFREIVADLLESGQLGFMRKSELQSWGFLPTVEKDLKLTERVKEKCQTCSSVLKIDTCSNRYNCKLGGCSNKYPCRSKYLYCINKKCPMSFTNIRYGSADTTASDDHFFQSLIPYGEYNDFIIKK